MGRSAVNAAWISTARGLTILLVICLLGACAPSAPQATAPATPVGNTAATAPATGNGQLTTVMVGLGGAGTPGTNAPELGVALGTGAFALEGLDVKWMSIQ